MFAQVHVARQHDIQSGRLISVATLPKIWEISGNLGFVKKIFEK